jgi:hypothetical protein
MKKTNHIFSIKWIAGCIASCMILLACNKEMEQVADTPSTPLTGPTMAEVLRQDPNDSLFYRLMARGGQLNLLNDTTKYHTVFATENQRIKPVLSGLAASVGVTLPPNAPDAFFAAFIDQIPVSIAGAVAQYQIIPQIIRSSSISNTFPNFSYPTIFNPAPTVSALARLNTYPSTRNGAWLNLFPITGVDKSARNGVIHHVAGLNVPAQRFLWDRISTDPELTYLKAAILRADSGVATTGPSSLQWVLSNFGPDITVFAPVDTAFQNTLKNVIAQALISQGVPAPIAVPTATFLASTPGVFTNPLLANALTPQTVKGIVVYHVLGKRAYTNNFPTTQTAYPTLLNTVLTNHPGVKLTATFNPPFPFVRQAQVKDVYNNSPAANIIINASPLTPDPLGTSDQNFVNGVMHKIDAVLLPQ